VNLFPNAWHVAKREYLMRVRSRAFIIFTVALAVVGLALALAPVGIRLIAGEGGSTQVGLTATDGEVQAAVLEQALAPFATEENAYEVVSVRDAESGRAALRDGELDGLLTVGRVSDGDLTFDYVTDASAASQSVNAVRQAATQLVIADRLDRAGVDPGEVAGIFAPARFELEPLDPNAPRDAFETANGLLAYVLVILTFMAIVTYGTWVATSVAEEKSSRVMELLITAATPRQLLAGKVVGTGAAGMTQYFAILVAALVGLVLQGVLAQQLFADGGQNLLEGVDFTVLLPFTLFFIPGFLLYCVLYAGFGSMASRQEDVTQVTGPMLFIGMGGYFASFIAMATPGVAWVKVLSLIPFFSPYLLSARYVLAGNIAPWEWLVAAVLMVLFLAGALWLAARIYSAGVLLYGQRSSFRSIWRAVRVSR
jgi:ABC-2 type transport system permease protein